MKGNVLYDENGMVPGAANGLPSITGVNGKNTGATALITVPAGKTLILLDVIARVTAADTVAVPPVLQVGLASSYNEWLTTATLTGATAVNKAFSLAQFLGANVMGVFTAGQVVSVNILTGATATTLTLAYDPIGYLI